MNLNVRVGGEQIWNANIAEKKNNVERRKRKRKNYERTRAEKENTYTINANHLFAIHTPDNQLINYVI